MRWGCTFGASSPAFAKVRAEVRRTGTAASQEDGSELPRNVPGGVQGEEPEAAKAVTSPPGIRGSFAFLLCLLKKQIENEQMMCRDVV